MVTGDTNLNNLSVMGSTEIGLISIDGLNSSFDALGTELKLQAAGSGPIQFMANKIEMTQQGNMVIKEGNLEIQEGIIKANDKIRAAVDVNAGQSTITVTGMSWQSAPVTITANASFDSYVWITNITTDGFTINVKNAPGSAEKVYWQALW